MSTGYLPLGGGLVSGRIRDFEKKVLQTSLQIGSDSSSSYFHIFFRIAFFEDFVRNIIIILIIHYAIIIILCINNNAIINNYGRLQDLILLFKIPVVMWKSFFDIY